MSKEQKVSRKTGKKSTCKYNQIDPSILRTFLIKLFNGDLIPIKAERVDFSQQILNLYIGREMIASFKDWSNFRELIEYKECAEPENLSEYFKKKLEEIKRIDDSVYLPKDFGIIR